MVPLTEDPLIVEAKRNSVGETPKKTSKAWIFKQIYPKQSMYGVYAQIYTLAGPTCR